MNYTISVRSIADINMSVIYLLMYGIFTFLIHLKSVSSVL